MKLVFLFVGGAKDEWVLEAEREYLKKISRYAPVEAIRLKPAKLARPSSAQKKERETADLLKSVKPDDILVACDERGEELGSIDFSRKLVRLFERGRPRVIIAIGGAYGLGDALLARADWRWSLSKLTYSHPLAQAVAMEQTYRALTIWKGIPYHNE